MNLARNLELTLRKIERARLSYNPHHIVSLIAVSKYQDSNSIQALYECGQRAFGENKVQDLKAKANELNSLPLEWHFIGTLQENKINSLLSLNPTLIHSVDSLKLALAIDKRLDKAQDSLLQINASAESSKSGTDLESAIRLYKDIQEQCKFLKLKGIMSIGANTDNKAIIEKNFKDTKDVFDKLVPFGAQILSMGMSNDFEIAIAYGANLVRIGSKLFA